MRNFKNFFVSRSAWEYFQCPLYVSRHHFTSACTHSLLKEHLFKYEGCWFQKVYKRHRKRVKKKKKELLRLSAKRQKLSFASNICFVHTDEVRVNQPERRRQSFSLFYWLCFCVHGVITRLFLNWRGNSFQLKWESHE